MTAFELHYSIEAGDTAGADDGGAPATWMLMLHGMFGRGVNWRTIARRLVAERPELGVALVDLRMHGESMGAPPPHTVAAAADDVWALADTMVSAGRPVRSVCGHSFGGKVALAMLESRPDELERVWVLDASPSARPEAIDDARPGTTVRVLHMLEQLPARFDTRAAFVAAVTERGHQAPLANWLAMNLRRDDGGFRFGLDLAALRALLTDYFARDLWNVVERTSSTRLDFIVAGRSDVVPPPDQSHIERSPAHLAILPRASHWLHVDAPDDVVSLLAAPR